jgi:glutathione S-transferase
MILIGRNLSPFVRRTAASLNLMRIEFTQQTLSTADHAEAIGAHNPLRRVPALILPGGEALLDSAAILDALDEMAGPERALIPPSGPARRAVLRAVALGQGAMEKLVAAYYERDRRPAALVWPDAVARLSAQAAAGFAALDDLAAASTVPFLFGAKPSQADVTATVALDFAGIVMPDLVRDRFAALAALRDRANALPAIGETRWATA